MDEAGVEAVAGLEGVEVGWAYSLKGVQVAREDVAGQVTH
jgi:hypothetical protein